MLKVGGGGSSPTDNILTSKTTYYVQRERV